LSFISNACLKELWAIAELIEDKIDVEFINNILVDTVG